MTCAIHIHVMYILSPHLHMLNVTIVLLACFSRSENLQGVLNESDTLGATVSIMKRHVVSPCESQHIIAKLI